MNSRDPDPLRIHLDADATPPPGLEPRVVRQLTRRGLVKGGRAPWTQRVAAVAAATALFVLGWTAGRGPAGADPAAGTQYLLLLYSDPAERVSAEEERATVMEYGRWAGDLRGRGLLVAAEKLADHGATVLGTTVAPVGTERGLPSGFFLIVAPDSAAAVRAALDSPHARRGGIVAVRMIEPT